MNSKEEIFLPMVDEALSFILSFIEIECVKPLFDFYKYRDQKGSKNDLPDVMKEKFPVIVEKERELKYHLRRMEQELDLLYNNTPPFFHRKVQNHITHVIELLEFLILPEQVTNTLKVGNLYKPKRFWDDSGEQMETPLARRKSETLDLNLLEGEYFSEYLALLNKLATLFKFEATRFLEKKEIVEAEDDDFLMTLDNSIRVVVINSKRFKNVLEYYKAEQEFPDKERYKVISYNHDTSQYLWNGIGQTDKIETLGQFIKRLFVEDIVAIPIKAPVSRAFLKLFTNLAYSDHAIKDLGREIDNSASPYRNYFSAIKSIRP